MRDWLQQLLRFLARWWAHLRKAKPVWMALAIPIVLALMIWPIAWLLSLAPEQYIRYTGGLLELAGIVTVALGLRDTRTLFARPSFRQAVADWFRNIPRWRQHHRLIAGTGTLTMPALAARAYGTTTAPPGATMEQRISALEAEAKNLSGRIQAAHDEFDEKITQQVNVLAAERREREEQVEGTRKLIDEAVAGGLVIEAIGLVWLVFGLVLATLSAELAKLFS